MTDKTQISFLKKEVDKSITTLKSKSQKNKLKTSVINGLSIFFGALITLTLGLDVSVDYVTYQKNLALIFGALLTIINSWNAIFDYKKLWVRQKTTLLRLYQLRSKLDYRLTDNGDFDLFEEYLSIWDKDSEEWANIVRSRPNTKVELKGKDS